MTEPRRPAGRPRIAVIGTGWWATQQHIPSLLAYENADLVALADTNAEKLRKAATHFGISTTFGSHRELLDAGVADAVVVAVPHARHYDVSADALSHGLHVLVEKPMVLKARQARELVALAAQQGVGLMVGYTFQYTRHAALAREIVQSGTIGDLQLVHVVFASVTASFYAGRPDDYAPTHGFAFVAPERDSYSDPSISGGGQGQAQVTHTMGMVTWVTGADPTEVSAYMGNFGLGVDLVDAIVFRLDNGALGTVTSTGNLRPGQPQHQGVTYYGSDGYLVQDMIGGHLHLERHDGTSEHFPDLAEDELYPAGQPARTLADIAAGRGDNRSPGERGRAVVEFLECAYRSGAEGRAFSPDQLS